MQTQASVPSVRKRLFYTNIYTEIENQKKKTELLLFGAIILSH